MPVCVPQLGTQQAGALSQPPGVAMNVPGGGSEWRCHPGTGPGPMPPGAASRDTGALSSQIRLRLHCNQSLTYCKLSVLWFCACWVFLSAAGQKEGSSLPAHTGCWSSLPCQGHMPRSGRQAGFIVILHAFKNPPRE